MPGPVGIAAGPRLASRRRAQRCPQPTRNWRIESYKRALCRRGRARLPAETWANEERRVDAESDGDGGKEPGDAKVEPVDRDEPAGGAGNHAHRVGVHGRHGAAEAQGDVEKSEAQPEQQIGRTDDAQVERSEENTSEHKPR